MKKLLSVVVLFLAVTMIGWDNTEVQTGNERLEIVCPKCGYVYYVCGVDEIFEMEPVANYAPYCTANKGVQPLNPGVVLRCPNDGTEPFYNLEKEGKEVTQIYTNKGWMPKRYRP